MKHNWEYKRLGDIAPSTPFKGIISSADGKYWCLNLDKIESNTGVVLEYDFVDGTELGGSVHKFTTDNVLFSKLRPNLNKVIVPEHNGYCTTELVPLHPLNILNKYYLAYYLRSSKYVNYIVGKTGGAKMPRVKMDIFWNSKIPVPPMEVQKKIVAELDKINEVIEDCRELLRNLDTLTQSLFYDFFGDPVTNPKGWKVSPLKDAVIEMFLGPFGSALKTDCYVPKEDGYAMIYEQKHAIKKTLNQENHFIDKAKFDSLKRFEILPNDFIMSCRGTIGQLYQVPNDSPRGIIHPSVMKIRLNPSKYNASFFKFLLPVIVKEQQTKGNCVQMAITAKELGAKKLPVPPLALQEKFAARIEQIEAQKKTVEEMIANLQVLLDSRMDYWFN